MNTYKLNINGYLYDVRVEEGLTTATPCCVIYGRQTVVYGHPVSDPFFQPKNAFSESSKGTARTMGEAQKSSTETPPQKKKAQKFPVRDIFKMKPWPVKAPSGPPERTPYTPPLYPRILPIPPKGASEN